MEILGIFSVFPIKLRIPVLPLLRFGTRIDADNLYPYFEQSEEQGSPERSEGGSYKSV